MSNDIAKEAIELAKKMFKDFTGVTLEYAKTLIDLEERLNAVSNDIPNPKDEIIPGVTDKKSLEPKINKIDAGGKAVPVPSDPDDQLPF